MLILILNVALIVSMLSTSFALLVILAASIASHVAAAWSRAV